MTFSQKLSKVVLEISAIKFSPEKPFTWASGYRMPIYNDNRLLLGNPDHRMLVAEEFRNILDTLQITTDVVAGIATAGIPSATSLANLIKTPLIYVRPSLKDHGMQNQVEGKLNKNQKVVVVEDLVSTGGSALNAIKAIRDQGGSVQHCLCIFSYGFKETGSHFKEASCELHPLLTFESLIKTATESNHLNQEQLKLLRDWHSDPFHWGDRKGFPSSQA